MNRGLKTPPSQEVLSLTKRAFYPKNCGLRLEGADSHPSSFTFSCKTLAKASSANNRDGIVSVSKAKPFFYVAAPRNPVQRSTKLLQEGTHALPDYNGCEGFCLSIFTDIPGWNEILLFSSFICIKTVVITTNGNKKI